MSDIYSIAFYNLENLFDYHDNDATRDKDYTPDGVYKWNKDKYDQKIENLSKVISKIGETRSSTAPILIGVCEVENEICLEDLINSDHLKPFNYKYVFHSSPDQRGINVAFLYQKNYFNLHESIPFKVDLFQEGIDHTTRDILLVKGKLINHPIHIVINHWPSRTDGTKKTNFKRVRAAQLTQKILKSIRLKDPESNILVMGDFNDDPMGSIISNYLSEELFNPMIQFQKEKAGSVKYKGKWIMFDQIMLNHSLYKSSWFNFLTAHIFVKPYLTQKSGRYKGSPKRTFIANYHQGGYSDHYPVFIYFKMGEQ